jgi:hypothetical protein
MPVLLPAIRADQEDRIPPSRANQSRDEARRLIGDALSSFYVYTLRRPNGEPFYVGKGQRDRVFSHEREAVNTTTKTYKLNIIRALYRAGLDVHYQIDGVFAEEGAALSRERELIRNFGRHNLGTGPLANQTDGGDGPANFSEETKQRHRDTLAGVLEDGSERSAVNEFFFRLGASVASVPIKPISEFTPEPLIAHSQPRQPTKRQAAALAAAAVANRILLTQGALIPRRLPLSPEAMIENGVGRDILKSGMAMVETSQVGAETLVLTDVGFAAILNALGRDVLLDAGILLPEP